MTVIQMSDRELTRLRVMIDLVDGRLTPGAAGTLMGIGIRERYADFGPTLAVEKLAE